jgi:serine/threonine-protein kinase
MADPIGPYEILGRLGAGGMGTVYRARDTRTDRLVALKVLKSDVAEDPDLERRFQLEADALRRLHHPNIVGLLDYGADDNVTYIAMEIVDGESLAQRLRRGGRLDENETRRIGVAVASALEAAHAQRIVHRDIKPGNILLGEDGSVKVSDFGVARVLDETRRTRTGTFLGSLAYAAPEAFDRPADERSDLYSLGVVLYECVTGKTPFRADTPIKMVELHRWEPPDLSVVDTEAPTLSALIADLLEKQPVRRPAQSHDVALALRASQPEIEPTVVVPLDTPPTTRLEIDSPPPPPPKPDVPLSSRPVFRIGVAAAAAAIVALGIFGGWYAVSAGDDGGDRTTGVADASTNSPMAVSSPQPTAAPPNVPGFPRQTLLRYGDRTLTVSALCGDTAGSSAGLRGLPSLDPATAVLFDLPANEPIPFWGAPGYSFAIDTVFIDDTRMATAIFRDIQPDEVTASSGSSVRYALEFAAGGAALHDITVGTVFQFDDPCAEGSAETIAAVEELRNTFAAIDAGCSDTSTGRPEGSLGRVGCTRSEVLSDFLKWSSRDAMDGFLDTAASQAEGALLDWCLQPDEDGTCGNVTGRTFEFIDTSGRAAIMWTYNDQALMGIASRAADTDQQALNDWWRDTGARLR